MFNNIYIHTEYESRRIWVRFSTQQQTHPTKPSEVNDITRLVMTHFKVITTPRGVLESPWSSFLPFQTP